MQVTRRKFFTLTAGAAGVAAGVPVAAKEIMYEGWRVRTWTGLSEEERKGQTWIRWVMYEDGTEEEWQTNYTADDIERVMGTGRYASR